MIKKGKFTFWQRFPTELFSVDVNVYMRHHKSMLFRMQFLFNGNYHLFAHSDISYGFNGDNDNIILE